MFKIPRKLTAQSVGTVLLGIGFFSSLLFVYPSNWLFSDFIKDFYANVSVECNHSLPPLKNSPKQEVTEKETNLKHS